MRGPLFLLAAAVSLLGCDEPVQLSESEHGAFEVSLTRLGQGLAAVWFDTRHGSADVYLRLVDEKGDPQGREFRLTTGEIDSFEPDVAALDEGLAIAWYEKSETGGYESRLSVWDQQMKQRWTTTLGPQTRSPVVRSFGDRIFCAWLRIDRERVEVRAAWWGVDGERLDSPTLVGEADRDTWHVDAEIDAEGEAWVTWDARWESQSKEIFLAHLAPLGPETVGVTTEDGFDSTYPNLALAPDTAALVWLDERDGNREIYLTAGLRKYLLGDIEANSRRITTSPGASIGAIVAWNGDRLGLGWSDDIDGQSEIFFQEFDEKGASRAGAEQITHNETSSLIPAIAPWGRGFALAWNELVVGEISGHNPNARSEIAFAAVR